MPACRFPARVASSVLMLALVVGATDAIGAQLAPGGASPARAAAASQHHGAHEYGCQILPEADPLNREIARAPVSPRSAQYIASIGLTAHLHPDFGTEPSYGIPYTVVPAAQPAVPVRFTQFGAESDRGPYPIPRGAWVEGGGRNGRGDKHVLVLQQGKCKLFELWDAQRTRRGWNAGSGAVFNLRSERLRPDGWTSADAAGLPIFPLLARHHEIASSGEIDHALRVTVPATQKGYIHPATHYASTSSDARLPPMGLRLRLKASYSLARFSGQSLIILRALKRYGLIVADNGSPWYITGAPSSGWNDANLEELKRVPGSAFVAVQSGPILRR